MKTLYQGRQPVENIWLSCKTQHCHTSSGQLLGVLSLKLVHRTTDFLKSYLATHEWVSITQYSSLHEGNFVKDNYVKKSHSNILQ